MTYKQAVNWADDIKEYTKARQMPPWKPSEGVAFHGERKLTDKEIATLAAWVDGGTPEGDPKDAPPPAKFTDGWQLGKPDLVLEPKEDMIIGAERQRHLPLLRLPTNLTEDKYVIAFEVRPGNPRVVHHTLNFFDTQGRARKLEEREQKREEEARRAGPRPRLLVAHGVGVLPADRATSGGWAPGQRPHYLPEGVGYYLPKGSDVVMQIHYHRNGRVEKDRTQIGLYFAKKPASKPMQPVVVPGRFLSIPAGVEGPQGRGR